MVSNRPSGSDKSLSFVVAATCKPVHSSPPTDQCGGPMKKTYEKPVLMKREKLSDVTAVPPSSQLID
jgi:hypothetical protein